MLLGYTDSSAGFSCDFVASFLWYKFTRFFAALGYSGCKALVVL